MDEDSAVRLKPDSNSSFANPAFRCRSMPGYFQASRWDSWRDIAQGQCSLDSATIPDRVAKKSVVRLSRTQPFLYFSPGTYVPGHFQAVPPGLKQQKLPIL